MFHSHHRLLHIPIIFQTRFSSTSSSMLDLCTKPQHLQQLHARFFLHGLHQNQSLSSKLMDCYAKFGFLDLSHKLFSTLKTQIPCSFVLRSCFCLSHEQGKMIHAQIVRLGLDAFDLVGRTLVELYDMNGFFNVDEPVEGKYVMELNYWNNLISEAFENGKMEESFKLFCRMRKENIQPNSITVIGLLRSTVELNSLKTGQALHSFVVVSCLYGKLTVNTALLSMYAKLGSLEDARMVFEKMPDKDLVVWNIMISAYSGNGFPKESLKLVYCMVRSGFRPDLFTAIPAISSITQLNACKMHSETRLAELAAQKLINMEPKNAGNYVLLSNIYAAAGNWDKVAKMRSFLRDRGLKKTPGCSWLELNGQVHEFRVADKSHKRWEDIYSILNVLELEAGDMEDYLELFDPSVIN
ncbi:hypothetical protein PHAVU_009G214700, partial [Phaseolus vulgaris]